MENMDTMSANHNTSNRLTLEEFEAASYEQWRKEAEATLDGAPFEKKLVTRTFEGIDVQPIYSIDPESADFAGLPGLAPYVRGTKPVKAGWEISQEIPCGTPRAFNSAAHHDLLNGQNALHLSLDKASRLGVDPDQAGPMDVGLCGISIANIHDMGKAFEGIDFSRVPLYLEPGSAGLSMWALLIAYLRKQKFDISKLKGSFEQDPIGELASDGSLPHSLELAYNQMALVTQWAIENTPGIQTLGVRALACNNAGGTAVQELAIALSTAVEYLRELEKRGLGINQVAPRIRFTFAMSGDFFMSIAKLRSARLLWARIVEASGGDENAAKMRIHARSSLANRSLLDPYVNMLRSTTEAFSAVVGGADSIHVGAFDEVIRPPDETSRRLARNIQIILKEECQFDHVTDPAGGAPYVESLTKELAQKAWQLFQQIEAKGGVAEALKAGFIQEQVNAAFTKKAEAVALRRESLIGVNVYANPTEKLIQPEVCAISETQRKRASQIAEYRTSSDHQAQIQVLSQLGEVFSSHPDQLVEKSIDAAAHGATLGELSTTLRALGTDGPRVVPMPLRRLSAPFEKLRAHASEIGAKVFLANMGPLGQHKARADFSTGFFQAGGFEVLGDRSFSSVEAAAKAATESEARVLVICSTDATYPELVPQFAKLVKQANPTKIILVAGYPKDHIEAFKEAGVDEFIHIRANCYNVLRQLVDQLAGATK